MNSHLLTAKPVMYDSGKNRKILGVSTLFKFRTQVRDYFALKK